MVGLSKIFMYKTTVKVSLKENCYLGKNCLLKKASQF